MDIDNVNALVTGGGSGLGRAAAEALAARGARVAVVDIDERRCAQVAKAVDGLAITADAADAASLVGAIDTARNELGSLRIAMCCHGILVGARTLGRDGPAPLDTFERAVRVNLVGSFNLLRLAAAAIAESEPNVDGERGIVLLTASIAAYEGQIGQTAYAASKAGVAGLVLPAARDLASRGIRVVGVAPGIFDTPMLGTRDDAAKMGVAADVPFPARPGRPSEFGRLACDIVANPMLNGTVVRLDGALRLAAR
jgi:NAD(P)-dependent dehydrogenase (short-subunit alcohol dehydrogenase family)